MLNGSQVKLWTSFYSKLNPILLYVMIVPAFGKLLKLDSQVRLVQFGCQAKSNSAVIDESYGNIRQSGPVPVNFGETISIIQKKPDDAPTDSFMKKLHKGKLM